MSEPLAELTKFSQSKDYDSLVGRHREYETEVENLRSELEETLSAESDLDDDQIDRIRETYIDVVQADLQALLENNYGLDGFSAAVEDIQNDIEEVLHNPKAEAVVDEIDSWIVSTGLEPLSGDEKRGIREAIISDVETSNTAVNQARSAHDALRGDLGTLQGQVDQHLRRDLVNVDAPSDLVEIRDSLQKLRQGWHGDWTLDHDLDVGKELNEQIWISLIKELQEDIEGDENLNKIAVLVSTRSERVERALSDINGIWVSIESAYRQLPVDVSYEESKLLTLLNNKLPEDPTVSQYRSCMKKVREGLETLYEIQSGDIENFQTNREPTVEEFVPPLEDIREALSDASDVQSKALQADSVDKIGDLKQDLEEILDDADEARTMLQNRLSSRVKTVRRLTEKFDIDPDVDMANLLTDTVGQDSVDRLLELSEKEAEVHQKARKQVREELPDRQAQLLEDLLALFAGSDDMTLENVESELGESYQDDLMQTLLGLQENELLDIKIAIT